MKMQINNYFTVPYVDGGRDISVGLDCWGLVRHVLHHEFNKPLLDAFGALTRHTKNHDAYEQSLPDFKECKARVGAVACCFKKVAGRWVFHHVGVCVGDCDVLHTASTHGVKKVPLRAFKRLAPVVKFFEFVGE